jgi:2-dehydropantoate 2-reductase
MEKARLLVIGAGVNGSACAAVLYRGGVDVTLLARGERYGQIQSDGVVFVDPLNGKRSVFRVPVVDSLPANERYDYILVVVRRNQVSPLLPALAANITPNIVFMGNTLSGPEALTEALGTERLLLGMVNAFGRREGGVIRGRFITSVAVPFGEPDGSVTPRLERLTAILNGGGYRAVTSRCIQDLLMTHAAGVPLIGLLTMKHGLSARELVKSPEDLRLFVDALRESFRVLRALGYNIVPRSQAALETMPRFLVVAAFRALLSSRLGVAGMEYHVSQAPDEMLFLAQELHELVARSKLKCPAIEKVLSGT